MEGFFYIFVWIMGVLICLIVCILYKKKVFVSKYYWYLFWIGFGLGMLWELPMSIANELYICCGYPYPASIFIIPTPIQGPLVVIVIATTHSFWDGGFFLLSVLFLHLLCKEPYFEKFRWKELIVLILVGQISELIVELISTFSEGWVFFIGPGVWYNLILFQFNNKNITLLPQLIWLAAPIVFYFIALKLNFKIRKRRIPVPN